MKNYVLNICERVENQPMDTRNWLRNIGVGLGALVGVSVWLSRRGGRIEPIIGGENLNFNWHDLNINYQRNGKGPALLFLHQISPLMSNFEWQRLFNHFAKYYTVFAPDLPSHGSSDRLLNYSPESFVNFVQDFITNVIKEPTAIVASHLSCAVAIAATRQLPQQVSRLVLISPLGLTVGAEQPSWRDKAVAAVYRLPIIGTDLYLTQVSKRRIRQFLNASLVDKNYLTVDLVNQCYRNAHQPKARQLATYFNSKQLNLNVRQPYQELNLPILVIGGNRSLNPPVDSLNQFVDLNRAAELRIFEACGDLPHIERSGKLNAVLEHWLETGRLAA